MIPAQPGTYAVFISGKNVSRLAVVAWDDDGRPMVVGEKRLIPASAYSDFRSLEQTDAMSDPVQLIPGGGWVASYKDGYAAPLVAWAVCRDGLVRALAPADDLYAESAGPGREFTVYHPDETDGGAA
ncbi:hypothetical protein [Mycolicibacter arupensis]|uniref:hypothetical protein n=1 Tax=Mycolicibacter arupensis TaxID=342002 RepID=UPI00122CD04E|nr:hypothetical protein [Mycolicibacter arupensis]KAA1431863.1 hypothetical protein F0402_06850 [Mycolicibacter arupensis]